MDMVSTPTSAKFRYGFLFLNTGLGARLDDSFRHRRHGNAAEECGGNKYTDIIMPPKGKYGLLTFSSSLSRLTSRSIIIFIL